MEKITMFYLKSCPHCHRAFELIDELIAEHPEYKEVVLDLIEENEEPDKAKGYDYWYVPTLFVDDEKIMEGVPKKSQVEEAFQVALSRIAATK